MSANEYRFTGYTALHLCASWGRLDCLKTMVSLGADNRLQTVHGETARDMADRYGKMECAEFLSCVGKLVVFHFAECALMLVCHFLRGKQTAIRAD